MNDFSSMPFIIAFTGAQGIGKSTLVRDVAVDSEKWALGSCVVHDGIGREAASRGVPVGEGANARTILEFARLHVRRERMIVEGLHLLDRCLVDLVVYAKERCATEPALIELVEELALASLGRIALVVRVPLIDQLRGDIGKGESASFREQIDAGIADYLARSGVDSLDVFGTAEERVAQVRAEVMGRLA